jgi:threonine dehydrogenase-like Zn-dependent dehydrogenase
MTVIFHYNLGGLEDSMRAIYVDKKIPQMLAVKMLRPLWSGVIWSPLSPVRVDDLPEPSLPGPRWVRVRNIQCGICATDLSLLQVKVSPGVAPAALPGNTRFYLGHEVVGEVVEIGSQVSRFQVGDRVVMESRFAGPTCHSQEIDPPCVHCASGQTRLCENASLGRGPVGVGGGWGDGYTAHEAELWPVPNELGDDQASLIEPMAVALHGVLRRRPEKDEHVLIIGAGIIGLLTVQAVKEIEPDCHLTVLARHEHQAETARRLGADAVLRGGDLYPALAEITGAKHYAASMNRGMLLGGFGVIYDCVGSAETLTDGLRWARAGGALVMVGISLDRVGIDLNPIWYQEVDLIGSHTFGVENWRGGKVHTFDMVIQMMQEGRFAHEGLITHRFPFEAHRRAISTAVDKRSGSIKVTFNYK